MPLSNHVTSLPLSIELRDAGWPQEGSQFYWCEIGQQMPYQDTEFSGEYVLRYKGKLREEFEDLRDMVACPIATELMERMPDKTFVTRWEGRYRARTSFDGPKIKGISSQGMDTAPDALAKLSLHLIKKGILRV